MDSLGYQSSDGYETFDTSSETEDENSGDFAHKMYFVKVKEIKSQHWQDMESKFKLLDKKHEEQLNIIEENHNYRLERHEKQQKAKLTELEDKFEQDKIDYKQNLLEDLKEKLDKLDEDCIPFCKVKQFLMPGKNKGSQLPVRRKNQRRRRLKNGIKNVEIEISKQIKENFKCTPEEANADIEAIRAAVEESKKIRKQQEEEKALNQPRRSRSSNGSMSSRPKRNNFRSRYSKI